MMVRVRGSFTVLLLLTLPFLSEGFASRNGVSTGKVNAAGLFRLSRLPPTSCRPSPITVSIHHGRYTGTQLQKTQSDLDDLQGQKPGLVILTMVMAFTIWGFTIPPEIRRAHVCTDDRCLADRSRCYDCKTIGELSQQVKDYYDNGGGIKWDFSVASDNPFLPENIGNYASEFRR